MTAFLACTGIICIFGCVCMAVAQYDPPFRGVAKKVQQSRIVPRCRDLPAAVSLELNPHW